MKPELEAYKKGWEIIRSCKDTTQLFSAYQWVWLYKKMYGKTERWNNLYSFCTKRRNRL